MAANCLLICGAYTEDRIVATVRDDKEVGLKLKDLTGLYHTLSFKPE